MQNIIGTCGACGGPVEVPMHSVDPTPRCTRCGRSPKAAYGPRIEMEDVPHGDETVTIRGQQIPYHTALAGLADVKLRS